MKPLSLSLLGLGLLVLAGLLPTQALAQPTESIFTCIITGRQGTVPDADVILIGMGAVSGTRYQLKTDFEGSVELRGLPGTYLISVGKAGYIPLVDEVELIPARLVTKIFTLETKADARLDPTVTTVTRSGKYTSEAPATSYVVTEQQIRDRGYMNLQDLMSDIPEITVLRNVSPDVKDVMGGRGIIGTEKFLILQDGIQISSASGDPNTIGYNYPITSAEQVEVILGPASALYGADAYAGVINIITDHGDDAPFNIRATSSYGRFGTVENAFTYNARVGTARVFVNGTTYTSSETPFWKFYPTEFAQYAGGVAKDSFWVPGAGGVSLPDSINPTYGTLGNAYSVHGGVVWKGFEVGFSQRKVEHSASLGDNPDWAVYTAQANLDNLNQNYYLKHRLVGGSKKWSLNSMLWRNDNHISDHDGAAYLNLLTGYQMAYKYNDAEVIRLTEQFDISLTKQLRLSLGGQVEQMKAIALSANMPAPYNTDLGPDEQNMTFVGTNVSIPFFDLKFHDFGVYGQLQYSIPKRGLDLLLGGRFDRTDTYQGSINPRAGIVWRPLQAQRNRLTMKLMYGEGYQEPSPWETYANYGVVYTDTTGKVVSPFYHMPNPTLKPEKLRTLEGSFVFRPTPNTLLAADFYGNYITDRILTSGANENMQNPVSPIDRFAGITFIGPVEIPTNVGLSAILGATLRWSTLIDLGERRELEAFASYSYTDGAYTVTDTLPVSTMWKYRNQNAVLGVCDLANTPTHALKGGFTLSWNRFALSPRFVWASSMKGQASSDGDLNKDGYGENLAGQAYFAPGYFVANVFARYEALSLKRAKIRVFVRVNNVFDARYYQAYFGGNLGLSRVPQDPLRWSGGLTVDLK